MMEHASNVKMLPFWKKQKKALFNLLKTKFQNSKFVANFQKIQHG